MHYDNNDATVRNYMNNLVVEEGNNIDGVDNKKEFLLQHIYNSGIRFDLRAENDFTFPINRLSYTTSHDFLTNLLIVIILFFGITSFLRWPLPLYSMALT